MKNHGKLRLGALCLAAVVLVVSALSGASLSAQAGRSGGRTAAGPQVVAGSGKLMKTAAKSGKASAKAAAVQRGPSAGGFSVTYLDVGQGDAELISCDGHYMLIDGGGRENSDLIYTVLKNRGIQQLDYMVATHPDEDHIGGLPGAFYAADVGTVYCSTKTGDSKTFQNLLKTLKKYGNGIQIPAAGTTFVLGSSTFTVLGPVAASEDTNNSSLVLRGVYGSTSFLFTGDAEEPEETTLLPYGSGILQSDVLKVGHHGSDTSSSTAFLQLVKPKIAVISCGKNNSYGHPNKGALERLTAVGAKIYRTDLQGDVTVTSDGKKLTVTVEKNKDAVTTTPGKGGTTAGSGAAGASGAGASGKGSNGQTAGGTASGASQGASKGDTSARTAQTTYVLNTSSHKIHLPGCSAVKKMAAHNKKTVEESYAQVLADYPGYQPCRICHPETTK